MMVEKKMFEESDAVKYRKYEDFGKVGIYLRHDEAMGACLICKDDFITPNMPKLIYALDMKTDLMKEKMTIKDNLNIDRSKYNNYHVFEKADGFNVLFYKYNDECVPKTRLTPKAKGDIRKVLNNEEFERKYSDKIEEIVDNGFIPVIEVYGKILEDNNIFHGSVNYEKLGDIRGIDYVNAKLIAVMKADYENFNYNFLPVNKLIEVSEEYELPLPKYYGQVEPSVNKIRELMKQIEEKNSKYNDVINEGYVLHCQNKNNYDMFKVKSEPIMRKDVIVNRIVSKERVLKELSKILLETNVKKIVQNKKEYLNELKEYIEEERELKNKDEKKITNIFRDKVSEKFYEEIGKKSPKELGKMGVDGFFINKIKEIQSKRE